MKISISEQYINVFQALASNVRLKIIRLLSGKSMNIQEIAKETKLSSAIITMHVRKLESAGIVSSVRVHSGSAIYKVCSVVVDSIEIEFPNAHENPVKFHEFLLPIGHYTDFSVTPTCGLATTESVIGYFDDPRCFLNPERVISKILWFTKGYVEYKTPNYLLSDQTPKALEISMELGSEAPGVNNRWPSDITFTINGIEVGQWISPGDFGGTRGKYTPEWWSLSVGQYGLLKILRIDDTGSYMDGEKMSCVTLSDINPRLNQWSLRISVLENAAHPGGVTIFGKGFGNYDQDIIFRLFYS